MSSLATLASEALAASKGGNGKSKNTMVNRMWLTCLAADLLEASNGENERLRHDIERALSSHCADINGGGMK